MAMKPEHASADLALGMRYNTLVDCSDDIDPETLHPGIEEEEEEEEEDDQADELGDDDRGDNVDPGLSEQEDDQDHDQADDGKDKREADDDMSAGDDPELDADALAELAGEGSKSKVVPHARFHEVNESLKQERAERLRLEEELARARGAAPKQEENAPDKPEVYDFNAAEDRYMDAVMDGDKEKAKEIRAEIRAEEQKLFESKVGQDAKKVTEEEFQKREQATENERLKVVLDEALKKYPFLNNDSEEADQDAIEDVIARRDYYLRKGMSPSKAVAAAVEKVAPRYAPAVQDDGDAGKGKPVKDKPAMTEEKLQRNVDRQRSIPPVMPGVGERGRDVDYGNLTEDEFDALPEAEKRKARGDFVSEKD